MENMGGAGSATSQREEITTWPSDLVDARSLGLAAFATTTFAFGLSYTTIWSPRSSAVMALTLTLVYGGAIQILAGIWAFVRRQVFPAVTFCSFGAFYVSYYAFMHSVVAGLSSSDTATASAVFFLAWLILSSYVFLAAVRSSVTAAVASFRAAEGLGAWLKLLRSSSATAGAYLFWLVTYLLLVIGNFLSNPDLVIGAGAAAIATAALAWFASGTLLLHDASRDAHAS
jgi:hypothetical protein